MRRLAVGDGWAAGSEWVGVCLGHARNMLHCLLGAGAGVGQVTWAEKKGEGSGAAGAGWCVRDDRGGRMRGATLRWELLFAVDEAGFVRFTIWCLGAAMLVVHGGEMPRYRGCGCSQARDPVGVSSYYS